MKALEICFIFFLNDLLTRLGISVFVFSSLSLHLFIRCRFAWNYMRRMRFVLFCF